MCIRDSNNSEKETGFKSPNEIMQGHELMKNHSRGTYQKWIDRLVTAVQDKCKDYQKDVISCIDNCTETTITLDTSLRPTSTPIKDAAGNVTAWTPINPMDKIDFERETSKYNERVKAYESNKQTACSIIKHSICRLLTINSLL